MLDGKRGTASTILYDAFDQIKEQTGNDLRLRRSYERYASTWS